MVTGGDLTTLDLSRHQDPAGLIPVIHPRISSCGRYAGAIFGFYISPTAQGRNRGCVAVTPRRALDEVDLNHTRLARSRCLFSRIITMLPVGPALRHVVV
jgi:hypothetical protein